jgi:hypothetical protein
MISKVSGNQRGVFRPDSADVESHFYVRQRYMLRESPIHYICEALSWIILCPGRGGYSNRSQCRVPLTPLTFRTLHACDWLPSAMMPATLTDVWKMPTSAKLFVMFSCPCISKKAWEGRKVMMRSRINFVKISMFARMSGQMAKRAR